MANTWSAVLSKWFSMLREHHQELGVVEPFWDAQLAVLVTIVLYLVLPARLTVGPRWLVPSLEGGAAVRAGDLDTVSASHPVARSPAHVDRSDRDQ
jgi:hypothetical protein